MTQTGLIPRGDGKKSMNYIHDNYMPFTLANLLKNIGYKVTSYHNHSAIYYDRHLAHPSLGYEYYACGRGLKINCKIWPESDLEMIEATADSYINSGKPFLTYYLTVSGHTGYTRMGNMMTTKNWKVVKDLPYSEAIRCYLATHVELDKALEKLIFYLE